MMTELQQAHRVVSTVLPTAHGTFRLHGYAVESTKEHLALVFGDLEGYVHFLARDTGTTQLRLPTDGSPVVAAPVIAGKTIAVVTRNGGVFGFRPE